MDPSADPALRGKKTLSPRTVESISTFSLESDFKKFHKGAFTDILVQIMTGADLASSLEGVITEGGSWGYRIPLRH